MGGGPIPMEKVLRNTWMAPILLATHVLISLAGFCVNVINICTGTNKMLGIVVYIFCNLLMMEIVLQWLIVLTNIAQE